jgi:hypothetical protein
MYPVPLTKSDYLESQVYSHQSFLRLTAQIGISLPKTESIYLKEALIIAT